MSVKRYLLWAGDDYYPGTGLHDLQGGYDTLDQAKEALGDRDWAEIVDHQTMEVVAWWNRPIALYGMETPEEAERIRRINEDRGWTCLDS